MILTATMLRTLAPKCEAEKWSTALGAAMAESEITTSARIAAFLGQLLHESVGLTVFMENLNYSVVGLLKTWPARFTALTAPTFAHHPEGLANFIYAGKNGNGDERSGDGWLYRGRGPIQLTGRGNYRDAGAALGASLELYPDSVLAPLTGARVACWFWTSRGCNALADAADIPGITHKINGGQNGLDERKLFTARALQLLPVAA
jgi:putative chitinase